MNSVVDPYAQKDPKRFRRCTYIRQHWFGINKFQSTFTEDKPIIINSFISRKIFLMQSIATVLTSIANTSIVMVFFNAGIAQHEFEK